MSNLALLYEQLSNDDKAWLGNQPAFETLSVEQIRNTVTAHLWDTKQLSDAPIARYAELFCREYFQSDRDQRHRCWVFRNKNWDPKPEWSANTKKVWLSYVGEPFACGYLSGNDLVLFLTHSWCKSTNAGTSVNIKHKDINISVSRQAVIALMSEVPDDAPNVFIDIAGTSYKQKAQSVKAVNVIKAREARNKQVVNMLQEAKHSDGYVYLSDQDAEQDALNVTRMWSGYIPIHVIQPLCKKLTSLDKKITHSKISAEDKRLLLADLRQKGMVKILQQLQRLGCEIQINDDETYIKAPASTVSASTVPISEQTLVQPAQDEKQQPVIAEIPQACTTGVSPALVLILQSMLAYIRDTNNTVAEFWEKRIQTEIPNMEV